MDDPSALLCEIRDSFTRPQIEIVPEMLPQPYSITSAPMLNVQIKTASEATLPNLPPDPRYCDVNRYNELQNLKDKFPDDEKKYTEARDKTNPFEDIGKSIFMNRAAIKIANIDAIYGLTKHFGGLLKMVVDGLYTYCDLCGGPGAFTQYLQFRWPDSMGYGLTLRNELDWNRSKLDVTRMNFIYGEDGTGNIYTNWQQFVQEVRTTEQLGVDLVLGDGGFDVESMDIPEPSSERDIEDKSKLHPLTPTETLTLPVATNNRKERFRRQEFLSSRLLLCQLLTAISILKTGGNFVCKIFNTVTSLSAELLFIASLCFDNITIFKPISSRPANAERYIICRGLRDKVSSYANILASANQAYSQGVNVISIISNELPEDFRTWLTFYNNRSIDRQMLAANRILRYLNGDINVLREIPQYNIHKALIIWNLPDNPMTKRSKIRLFSGS